MIMKFYVELDFGNNVVSKFIELVVLGHVFVT